MIAGGTGFIGYHLCLFFKKKKWTVHSLSKFKPRKKRLVKEVKYIFCDISDRKKLKAKLDDYYDFIVNASGYVDHGKNKSIKKTHFLGCKNLINNFINKKPKKFIQLGSCIEYGNIKSPQIERYFNNINDTNSKYGDAKLLSTKFLLDIYKKKKYPVSILRLYLVYGPNQDNNRVIPYVVENSLKNKVFNCSSGKQFRDFIYISDLVSAVYKTLKTNIKITNGEIINIGSGKPIKIKKLIDKIINIIGSGKPKFSKIKLRSDEIVKLYPKIHKAKKLINWSPKINLEIGLKKTINFYKNEKS